ncbi:hypothetical protein [Coralloluteibacterium thermophilus]|uniref:Uncharacterized protein n=1 Tax=Coralloluteibacterium thermophilum TaxID=2707049 RepID=A0ABV9NIC5_9GAMM
MVPDDFELAHAVVAEAGAQVLDQGVVVEGAAAAGLEQIAHLGHEGGQVLGHQGQAMGGCGQRMPLQAAACGIEQGLRRPHGLAQADGEFRGRHALVHEAQHEARHTAVAGREEGSQRIRQVPQREQQGFAGHDAVLELQCALEAVRRPVQRADVVAASAQAVQVRPDRPAGPAQQVRPRQREHVAQAAQAGTEEQGGRLGRQARGLQRQGAQRRLEPIPAADVPAVADAREGACRGRGRRHRDAMRMPEPGQARAQALVDGRPAAEQAQAGAHLQQHRVGRGERHLAAEGVGHRRDGGEAGVLGRGCARTDGDVGRQCAGSGTAQAGMDAECLGGALHARQPAVPVCRVVDRARAGRGAVGEGRLDRQRGQVDAGPEHGGLNGAPHAAAVRERPRPGT